MTLPALRLLCKSAFLSGVLAVFMCSNVRADGTLIERWRNDAAQTRILAENDIPAAYKQAQRLRAALPADATPEDRARLLNLLARIELYRGETDSSDKHARQAFDLAKKHGDRAGQAEADLCLALNTINQGRIDDMSAAVTHAMTILQGVDRPDLLAEAMLRTSMMYRRYENYDDAVTMAIRTVDVAKRSRNALALSYAYQGMAMASDFSGRTSDTKAYYEKMLEQARAAGSGLLAADAKLGLSGAFVHLGDIAQAELMIREAMAQYRAIGGPVYIARSLFSMADVMRNRGRTDEAVKLISEAERIHERLHIKIGLWWALHTRSADLRTLGKIAQADADAERAYQLAQEFGFPLYLRESARRMAEIAAARGEHKRAYQLSVEATEMAAKVERERAGQRMVDLASRYEAESRQRQLAELQRHNEQQAAELKQRLLQQRWLWTLLASVVAILGVTAFFLFRLRRSSAEIRALNIGLERRIQERTAELRQQARYMRTLIDMLPFMVWLRDTGSRFLAVNRAVAEAAGQPVEALIGKNGFDLFPKEEAIVFHADDAEVMASRKIKVVEEQVTGPQGRIWIETYKAPVVDDDGTVLGTVGSARNITEQKAVAAAREAALDEAQRLAQVRSAFLAQMSHELRTPLNGILGYAQLLRRGKNLDERQLAGLNVIQQSGEHLLTLINDILDSAKIEAGKEELNLVDIPLKRFLRTIVEIVGVKAELKQLELVGDFAPDLPEVIRADEKRLRQVLLNLLANAVKFTDRGRVELHVHFLPPSRLCFEVRDSGIGIAEQDLETIFQPFEQVGEVQRRLGGTGLGLAISRQFVRLMGSNLEVESRVGAGSVFRFMLEVPVVNEASALPSPTNGIAGYGGTRKKVLVVDDVAENRAVLIDMLGLLGFDMFEARSGREAIAQAKALHPDLILMDVFMPDMDGLQAIGHLRQLPEFAKVPMIAVSASVSGSDEDSCLAAGASAFVPKPVDLDRLLAQIGHWLQITWIRETSDTTVALSPNPAGPFTIPPQDEMEELHRMAQQGNMRDITQMAVRLAGLDARYQPFADHLLSLAKGFQSRAILSFVEQHMDGKPKP